MPRKSKKAEPKENIRMEMMEDKKEMEGKGAIPTQVMVENAHKFGGRICCLCKNHIDMIDSDSDEVEMKGEGHFSKFAEKVEDVSRKGASKVKKASKKVAKYVSNTEGLASDVVNYGIPATTGAVLGALAAPLGPVGQMTASAVGSKLGTMAADKIAKESPEIESRTGKGLRKPRFVKGSEEAKRHMAELRAKRQKK